jgi:hypothetical protein
MLRSSLSLGVVSAAVAVLTSVHPALAQSCAERQRAIKAYAESAHLATAADVATLDRMHKDYYARCSGGGGNKGGSPPGRNGGATGANPSANNAAGMAAGAAIGAAVASGGGRGSGVASTAIGIGMGGILGGIIGEVMSSGPAQEPPLKHSRRKRKQVED